MFIVKNGSEDQQESADFKWSDVEGDIRGVYLIHPLVGISVGLHDYDRYAFMYEGVATLQRGNFPRVAEHLFAQKQGLNVHVSLHQSGLEIAVINTLGHAEDGFNAKYGEGQHGQSNNHSNGYPAWLGATKPVEKAKPKQGRNDQKRGRVGKSLKKPNSEQGQDHMEDTAKAGPIN